jgi:hypothetical protein
MSRRLCNIPPRSESFIALKPQHRCIPIAPLAHIIQSSNPFNPSFVCIPKSPNQPTTISCRNSRSEEVIPQKSLVPQIVSTALSSNPNIQRKPFRSVQTILQLLVISDRNQLSCSLISELNIQFHISAASLASTNTSVATTIPIRQSL